MKKVLETKNLSKHFGGLKAVDQVTMHVEEGEILGLIGPNGAGKTTFINAVAGLNPPTAGRIYLFGEETTGLPPEKICRRGLARTFQIPRPFPKLTVLDNVMMASVFGRKKGDVDPQRNSLEMLEFVEFPKPETTISESLNTVQLKRLDLARALASSPKLLFLDELAAGLTEGELSDIGKIVRKISEMGITILMVEHIMQLIMSLCDRLIVLHFGTKIAEGPTREIAQDPKVTEVYFGAAACQAEESKTNDKALV
ncbi:MAG: ABC transporter ATP-binding protein [Deltaproteobacteria bacterium]|nr:ABC transporter ATP-binding protein [Deltaproteobacteria bacterium]